MPLKEPPFGTATYCSLLYPHSPDTEGYRANGRVALRVLMRQVTLNGGFESLFGVLARYQVDPLHS